nr:chromosome transmission fidelity protein 8 [Quercus suber]
MPTINLHPPAKDRHVSKEPGLLPQLLQTPSGLAILEIQGTINTPPHSGSAEAVAVGQLTFPLHNPELKGDDDMTWMKRVYLYVGKHQRMTGEVQRLPKPIAVIQKRRDREEVESHGEEDLEIVEIVYYKVLFAHRPEPVGTAGGVVVD